MIAAMTSGTISSKDASSSLNSGAQIHSFSYSFKYFNICFIFSPFRFDVADYSSTIIDYFSHIYKQNDTQKDRHPAVPVSSVSLSATPICNKQLFHFNKINVLALIYMLLDCFKALRTDDMLYTACVLSGNLLIYTELLKTL